jgi:predicted aspartyl protease
MRNAQRFNFVQGFDTFGVPDALPQLPLSLTYRGSSVEVLTLLDTGASVNVLPYRIALEFNLVRCGKSKQFP